MKKYKSHVCIKQPFEHCDRIFPNQQKYVSEILNSLKKDENIKKIIIFGSSLKPTCHIDSDIDIYLELDKNKRVNFPFITKAYDYWNNFTVDANLRNEIKKTGVTIYER